MKSILVTVSLAFALSFTGGAAYADDKQADSKANPEKRVCKRVKVTGTRIKEKVCRKQRDWDALREESRETVDRARDGGNQNLGGGDT